jgi:hypothetical protein
MPKYISSGVWPEKAACGIWVLCWSRLRELSSQDENARSAPAREEAAVSGG